MVKYAIDFFSLVQGRCDLNNEKMLQFIGIISLRLDMRHLLAFQNFETVDEVVQRALKVKEIANCLSRKLALF